MNAPKKNHIAYRCPACGTVVLGMVGRLSAAMLRVKCPCGESALQMHLGEDKKVRFGVPCVFCKQSHSYVVSEGIVFDRDRFSLACPYSRMDILFLGDEEIIRQAFSDFKVENNHVFLKRVVSRKKQLAPQIMMALQQ